MILFLFWGDREFEALLLGQGVSVTGEPHRPRRLLVGALASSSDQSRTAPRPRDRRHAAAHDRQRPEVADAYSGLTWSRARLSNAFGGAKVTLIGPRRVKSAYQGNYRRDQGTGPLARF